MAYFAARREADHGLRLRATEDRGWQHRFLLVGAAAAAAAGITRKCRRQTKLKRNKKHYATSGFNVSTRKINSLNDKPV